MTEVVDDIRRETRQRIEQWLYSGTHAVVYVHRMGSEPSARTERQEIGVAS